MKTLLRLLFGTYYGAAALGIVFVGLILFTPWVMDVESSFSLVLLLEWYGAGAALVTAVVAFVRFVVRREWKLAGKQFLMTILVGLFLLVGIVVDLLGGKMCFPCWESKTWDKSEISETIPFSIEFRKAHAYLAEYERRITFKSGKSDHLPFDSGGCGEFAVYALKPDEFIIVDCLKSDSGNAPRSICRVNIRHEVSLNAAQGTNKLRQPLDGLKFLGRIYPNGKVKLGGEPPKVK